MMKNRLKGKWLVMSSIALVIAILGAGGYYSQHKPDKQGSPSIVQAVQIKKNIVNKVVAIKPNESTDVISDQEAVLYNKMHKMINTKIVAVDGEVWGEVPITTNNCNQLIAEVKDSGYPDKVTLLQFLTTWKNNDYANGVNQHNYLWNGLHGTIGKAKSLRN
ncbi:DUF6241 domain-containing protein [Clostridium psychrophilum]|uniref:DUF6241 domain-containing protein n=1 Tax=Clostridium psychrophilum TaxID=132926 RepID=UPI001C0CE5BB|nr:DUF6241 domain-containing protein [Clostridium psychrophilum]MBU3180980.1 hypothetical protein [Clostridium psychrophilum]